MANTRKKKSEPSKERGFFLDDRTAMKNWFEGASVRELEEYLREHSLNKGQIISDAQKIYEARTGKRPKLSFESSTWRVVRNLGLASVSVVLLAATYLKGYSDGRTNSAHLFGANQPSQAQMASVPTSPAYRTIDSAATVAPSVATRPSELEAKTIDYDGEFDEPVPQKFVMYRVRRGQTLSTIARRHHVGVEDLMAYNRLRSPDEIRKGQKLRIPVYHR